MTRQIVLRTPASMVDRRQPLLEHTDESSRGGVVRKMRFGEVAGGTAAECAAVCCCCPCGLVNLLFLAVYKVPAGLCRKALRKNRRRRLMKKGLLPPRKCDCEDSLLHIHPVTNPVAILAAMETASAAAAEDKEKNSDNVNNRDVDNEVLEQLEKEMWDKFYGTGFWRSSSQRSDTSSACHLNQ